MLEAVGSSEPWPPIGLLIIPQWNYIDGRGEPDKSNKTLSQCHFIYTNPTWTDPGANSDLNCGRLVTNYLSHGMAFMHD
jgi:hypothetical protein